MASPAVAARPEIAHARGGADTATGGGVGAAGRRSAFAGAWERDRDMGAMLPRARDPAHAFPWVISLDDVPVGRGFVVSGEPQQRFE